MSTWLKFCGVRRTRELRGHGTNRTTEVLWRKHQTGVAAMFPPFTAFSFQLLGRPPLQLLLTQAVCGKVGGSPLHMQAWTEFFCSWCLKSTELRLFDLTEVISATINHQGIEIFSSYNITLFFENNSIHHHIIIIFEHKAGKLLMVFFTLCFAVRAEFNWHCRSCQWKTVSLFTRFNLLPSKKQHGVSTTMYMYIFNMIFHIV